MENININSLNLIFSGGTVRRFHTTPIIGEQTNAEHQWGVAVIVNYIYPQASKGLILAALHHDSYEHITGDLPAPVKWGYPELDKAIKAVERSLHNKFGIMPALSAEELSVLKAADLLETMTFCVRQGELGNHSLSAIYDNCHKALNELIFLPHNAMENAKQLIGGME